ncbi:MAG: glycosyltransferase family 25 protein [Chitinophagaceae bacterium]
MKGILVDRVFVAHVKKGYENRRAFMEKQLAERAIPFEFMLEGDMEDITEETLERNFSGELKKNSPVTSCALKHLLIWRKIVEDKIPYTLILEDDAILDADFNGVFNRSVTEARERADIDHLNLYISYENTGLEYLPAGKKRKGQLLYKAEKTRAAGAYLLSYNAARIIVEWTNKHKMDVPNDWWQNKVYAASPEMSICWCFPTIVEQGSHNGVFRSALQRKKRAGFLRRIGWVAQRFYKKYIYSKVK